MYQFTIPQAFWDGECFDAYRWMGAHPSAGPRGEAGWQFTLFAPGAKAVSVCGSWPTATSTASPGRTARSSCTPTPTPLPASCGPARPAG